ncbi:MAG TPA: protein prkA [Fibrobacteria bacterium]|nr:protein prkA [Fibrobacteria bacterium]
MASENRDNLDFQSIINENRAKKSATSWSGTCLEYLEMVKKKPEVAMSAPGRLYNMIISQGTSPSTEKVILPGYEDLVKYNFFDGQIFGVDESIHDIVKFFHAGARRTETGKRILMLVGPVSSGKSSISSLLKKRLEEYSADAPIYAIEGCPMSEEPLHLVPRHDRPKWEEILGVKIEGDLCPICRHRLLNNPEFKDEKGNVLWEKVRVKQTTLSERGRRGIGTFQPSDPKNQDISELIGHVDFSKITEFGETDPRAYSLDGELEISNRGLIEYIEILKCDIKFHYVLITVAQEQLIKVPGFPQIYTDLVILSHTNQTEFDKFKANKENEALHDRMYPIYVPYNLKVDDEVKIYKKMIASSQFTHIDIAPYSLEVAAMFAVLTRLTESSLCPDLIKKMKYYNGEAVMEQEKDPVDFKALKAEGRKKGEGMFGISPRFVVNAINVALSEKEKEGSVMPLDIIRSMRNNFGHHIGFSEEEAERYLRLLMADKNSVNAEYREIAKKEVNRAFLFAYEDQAQSLFDNYIKNTTSFCLKKKITDPVTGEPQEPDEKLMRSIEEMIGVSENAKREFRQGIFVFKSDAMDQGKSFDFKSYQPLNEAIERKLMADLKNVVSLTIADPSKKDPKSMKRRQDAIESLKEKGYSEKNAERLLQYVGEVLRKEE